MKIKINRIDLINKSSKNKAKSTRRIGAYLIDIFVIAIIATILSIVSDLNIVPNLDVYKNAYNNVIYNQQETYKAINDTKLLKFKENENHLLVMEDDNINNPVKSFKEYALNHVNGTVTDENDPFEYYYLTYRKNYNFGEENEYNQKYLNINIFGLNDNPFYNTSSMWEYNSIDDIPTLSTYYKDWLSSHFDGIITNESQNCYNNLYEYYYRIYHNAINEFMNDDKSIYPNLYNNYLSAGEYAMSIRTINIFICTSISIIVYYFSLPFIFGNGETLGKRLFRLAVINNNKEKIPFYKVIFRHLILLICNLYITSIPVIFLGNSIMFSYLFKIGTFNFNLFYVFLFSVILSLVSLGLSMFSKSKNSIDDLLTRSEVIDIDE